MIGWFDRTAMELRMRLGIFHRLGLVFFLLSAPSLVANWEPAEIIRLEYPRLAQLARISGIVIVRLSLASDGTVRSAEVVSGHKLLADAARKNAARWKFKGSGRETRKETYVVYRFVLDGTCVDDCRTNFTIEFPNFVTLSSQMPSIQPLQN
jgi:TonB family protein